MQHRNVEPSSRRRPKLACDVASVARTLEEASTETGRAFIDLVEESPVLLVFLRHAGCTFCREALSDIALTRLRIEASGTRIVLVHMGDRAEMEQVISRYGLSDVERICDTNQELYSAFGLEQASWAQLFGPKVWFRGLLGGMLRRHGFRMPVSDYTQMPGVFLIEQGSVTRSYRHRSTADRPCYSDMCVPVRKAS